MSLTTVSSATRYYARPRRGAPTITFLELFSPMVAGLALRVIIDAVTFQDVRLSGTLIGLWEGGVLLFFIKNRKPSEPVYLAYALRVLVDFSVTESIFRLMVVLLWTTVGMVVADVAPAAWTETGAKRQWSRFRRDVSRSAGILLTRGPTAMAEAGTPEPAPVVRTRPVKRPLPGTFPGAEWSETESRPGTVVEMEVEEEEDDDEDYEDEEDEQEEEDGSYSEAYSYTPAAFPREQSDATTVPVISPQSSDSSGPDDSNNDSNTFVLTTPPQSPRPT